MLIVFFLFSSACEFWFIERIGTHGKQNPDFIIIIIITKIECRINLNGAINLEWNGIWGSDILNYFHM